jgi:hypothetical protein
MIRNSQIEHYIEKRRTTLRKSTIYLFIPVLALAAIVASTGLIVSAQNSNSSTTMTNSNSNSAPMKHTRGRRRTPKKPAADTGMDMAETTTTPAPRRTGRCDPSQQEQTDLSGTYNGKVKHGNDAAMDATLTITGNNFTMTSGSESHSGRVTAVTTCGYTAATFMMGDLTPPTPGPNPPPPNKAMSLRAKKVGDSLTLTSVAGEPETVMFTSGGSTMRPRRHRRPSPPPAAKPTPTPQQ